MPTFDELWPVRTFRGVTGRMLSLNTDADIFMRTFYENGKLKCILCTLFTGNHYWKELDIKFVPNNAMPDQTACEYAGEFAVRTAQSHLRQKALKYTRRADYMETLLQNYPSTTEPNTNA